MKLRRFFAFRLRALFVLIGIFSIVAAIAGNVYRRARVQRTASEALLEHGWDVMYAYEGATFASSKHGQMLLNYFERDVISDVAAVQIGNDSIPTNSDLQTVSMLPKLHTISIVAWQSDVTDEGICSLHKVTSLETLIIHNCDITDRSLNCLKGNKSLRTLSISGGKFTHEAVQLLAEYPALEVVTLVQCGLTQADEQRLHQLRPDLAVSVQ
jgi:hypothetical protein